MTLRELLINTPFSDIAQYIMHGDNPEDACTYKQAYDILLHTSPCEEGCRRVYVCKVKESDGSEYIDASHLEGQNWATYIDGEVVVEEGIDVPDTELVYRLLWHLTFSDSAKRKTPTRSHRWGVMDITTTNMAGWQDAWR